MRKKATRPTDAELEILRVLWEKGSCTVRDVFDTISQNRPTGYTTILKLMQIMAEKKLVTRDESNRTHLYKAKSRQEQTQKQLVADLIGRAFGGAANKLVMQALQSKTISPGEIEEIRRMLDQLEGETG